MANGEDEDDVSRAKKPPRAVTLAKNPPGPVTLAKNPPGPVTLAKNPPGPVTLAKNPPGPVTLAKKPPGPVTLAKNPPGPVTLAKNPPGPVTLAKNPPGPVTLAKNPPGPVTLAKNPPGPVTLAKNPPGPVTLAKNPPSSVTLAKNPPGPVTLAKNPPGPVTLAKKPPGPVTLAEKPPGPVTLAKNPPGPVTLAKKPPGPATLAEKPPPASPRPIPPLAATSLAVTRPSLRNARRLPTARPSRHQSTTKRTSTNLIDNFMGIGSTHRRRSFWNAARDAVLSMRKLPGTNVSVNEYPGKGSIISVSDRATPPSACSLPAGDCPKAVCFELKLDDTDASNQDFFDMFYVGAYFDGTDWQVYGDTSASLTATDPYNTWHKFVFQLTKQMDGSVLVAWSVDGVAGPSFNALAAGATSGTLTSIQFGAQGGAGAKHRSIRNITILGFSISFDFPPDSFSYLVGTGITQSGGVLRIDNDTDDDAYGNKVTNADLICCTCPDDPGWRDCSEISALDFTYDFTGHNSTTGGCTPFTVSGSWTFHFDRIDLTDTFDTTPGIYQFKAYQHRGGDDCVLTFVTNVSSGFIRHDFPIQDSACSIIFERLAIAGGSGSGCNGGTLSITSDVNAVSSEHTSTADCSGGDRCGSISCGVPVLVSGVPWLPGDVSGLIGTYVSENTCDDGDPTHISMTVTTTVVIS